MAKYHTKQGVKELNAKEKRKSLKTKRTQEEQKPATGETKGDK